MKLGCNKIKISKPVKRTKFPQTKVYEIRNKHTLGYASKLETIRFATVFD